VPTDSPGRPPGRPRRSWLGVVSRIAAAAGGGYALAAASAAWLSLVLPLTRVEATVTATLLSIVVYVCAVMWAFAARTAGRAWLGVLGPAAVLAVLVVLQGTRG